MKGTRQNNSNRKDVIVSVRMPQSLVLELQDIQKVNHFLDLSDEIRYIVRQHCLSLLQKLDSVNKDIVRSKIENQLEEAKTEQKKKEQVISELTKIIDNLKGGAQ